jgi:hypothetical protein
MSLSVALLLSSFVLLMMLTDLKASTNPPYPTGSYPQLVRQFYTTRDGLPSEEVRAIAITREGVVLAAVGDAVVKYENGRWVKMSGPSDPAALLATQKEVDALAGTPQGIWALSNGTWRKEEGSPANVIAFSEEPGGAAWALAPSGIWRREGGWKQVHRLDEEMVRPRGLCAMDSEKVYVASESGLFGLMGKRKYWLRLEVRPGGLLSNHTRAIARLDKTHLLVATERGLNLTNGQRGWYSFTGAEGLPILNLTTISIGEDGTVWLGSNQGLVRWSGGSWTYLAGQRWLPDNRVTALVAGKEGSVWVGTPKGIAHITHHTMTLAEKADYYQKELESRNRRHGYVTVMQLPAPGVLEGSIQEISDNDGLWTALYIAAQSFRYAVTKAPEARAQAWRSMQALLRLESITGIPGFPARAISHKDEPGFPLRSARSLPEWHPSPVERDWWWKGDTSSDELDGHFFAWYVFYELAANEEEKKQVRATCKRVMDHILDHNYTLVDIDGKHTTWGVWAPEKLNDDPMWWEERGLNSLEILSHLKVAHHIVGDPRYERAYRELIEKHHYAINTIHTKIPAGVSHDDQLAFLSFYPLLQLEKDPALRAIYLAGLKRTWAYERAEASPFWNFIYGACTGEPCDVEAAVHSLREMPLDFIDWEMKNSHRADLKFDRMPGRTGEKRLAHPLSWVERPMHKWDKDPYLLDGGSGRGEIDQTLWLLPYWLGRYHRLIE